jgi:cell division septum initiation protein DivIVA
VIDRDTPARLVPRTGQAELTPAAAQVSELEATITRRTKDIETLVAQRNQLQSQIRQLSFEISDATRRLSEVHRQVMQAEKAKIAAQHATPIIAHQPFPPVSYRELPSISPRPTREAPIPVRQLLSARRALVENNSPEARGLLESAQTSIIFEPGDVAPERASVAAAQIADALSMLNSGHTMGALPYLNRAITAMQPVF